MRELEAGADVSRAPAPTPGCVSNGFSTSFVFTSVMAGIRAVTAFDGSSAGCGFVMGRISFSTSRTSLSAPAKRR